MQTPMTTSASPLLAAPGRTAGYVLAASGAALFSTKAIFIKLAYQEQVNASLMLAYRMAFALPFFLAVGIWAVRARGVRGEPMPDLATVTKAALTGLLGYYVASYFDFAGLQYISAQLERLVLFTYPIFIMFIAAYLSGQAPSRSGITAAAVTYAGLALAFASDLPIGGHDTIMGTLLVIGAALSFAVHQIFAKGFVTTLGSALYTAISLTSAAIACIVHHVIVSRGDFSASPRFMGLAAGCAVVATVLPALLINASLARISSTAVAMISTLSPIVTIILAVTILGEPFTWADAAGSLLVIAGVGLYTRGDSQCV